MHVALSIPRGVVKDTRAKKTKSGKEVIILYAERFDGDESLPTWHEDLRVEVMPEQIYQELTRNQALEFYRAYKHPHLKRVWSPRPWMPRS